MDQTEKTLASLRSLFGSHDMVLLASSVIGRTIEPAGFVAQVFKDIATADGVILMMIKNGNVDANSLMAKLTATSLEQVDALVAQLDKWKSLPAHETMAGNGLPAIATLQRIGLVERGKGEIAWGCLRLRLGSSVFEFILRDPEHMPKTESRPTYDLAAEMIWLVDVSETPEDDAMVMDCAYRIVKASGWRRCLVVLDDYGVRVTELSIADFLQDESDGSLNGLMLAGINAPDPFQG